MKLFEKFYGRFGEDVKGVVMAKARPDGDINHLLRHLGLPPSGILDRQHRTLQEFVTNNGKAIFIKAVGQSNTIAVKKLLQDVELEKVKNKRRQQADALARRTGVAAPEELEEDEAPANLPPGQIRTPTYSGPDRRKRADRRVGTRDRRVTMELITFKNRRFGGQRRKARRRSTD
jgi:hypothetical protein